MRRHDGRYVCNGCFVLTTAAGVWQSLTGWTHEMPGNRDYCPKCTKEREEKDAPKTPGDADSYSSYFEGICDGLDDAEQLADAALKEPGV